MPTTQPDGSVKNKRVFRAAARYSEGKESGADGMALDREDRVYITTVAGVQVFDAAGKYSARSKFRGSRQMRAFRPDKRVLYITAREGLYRWTRWRKALIASANERGAMI
jgi:sugar lactone lactonase YvrE